MTRRSARAHIFWMIYYLTVIYFSVELAPAAAQFTSEAALRTHGAGSRSLLQIAKNCPINFEFQNYTIITSQCKGPSYPKNICCAAFKEFACPFATELSDLTNNCASTMFSYINIHGKYPAGLFANECKEGQKGLECVTDSPEPSASKAHQMVQKFSSVLWAAVINLFGCFIGTFIMIL